KGSPYEKENKIVCAGWKVGKGHPDATRDTNTKFHAGTEFDQQELVAAVERAGYLVSHNSKFEYGWLERCGLDISKHLAFCTMIAEYVISSNRRWGLSLDDCLLRRDFITKSKLGTALLRASVCPSTWPESWLRKYSIRDVEVTEHLFLAQRAYLLKHDQLKTAFTRNILTPVLVDIEKRGMHIDKERVLKVHRDYVLQLSDIEQKLSELTGGANPASPKQMREVIYEKLGFRVPTSKKYYTNNGEPTTSYEKYLITLKPKNKRQKEFLQLKNEYSKVNAALTKCLNKFTDCVVETEDHILTASLNQTITATQRLSSTGKNYGAQFQNFPRIFKPLFSARKAGWYIGEIDQRQLEYRVAVWYGQDEEGLKDIKEGVDSHAYTASHIFGKRFTTLLPSNPIYKELRFRAKAHTFKPLYGGQSGTADEKRYYTA
ncbi:MAG: DNA polymerase, partial [Nitrosopumilus sp.]